ncbi:MAG: biotin/lipoyl-binding protein, partial [Candidatus Brocadiae bacterium]|nr:biotin/lipoyl-binding protein [Candidatus Brocadiia bacterium]
PVQDKPGEIRRDKSLMECKEEKPKHPAEKKEDKVSKEYTRSWFAHPIPAFYFFLMFIPLLIVFFIFAKRDSVDAVPLIKTGFATQEDFEPVLIMEGKIASLKNEIFSFSQGIVTEILCKEGDFVRKGDALVRLSNPIAKEELQQAKHLFSQAVLEWQEAILQWDAFKKRQEAEKKNEGIENFSKKLEEFQKQFSQVLQDQDLQNFPEKLKEKRISLENSFLEYYKTLNPNQSKLFFWEIKYHSAYQQVLSSFLNWKQKENEGKALVIPSPDNGQVHALFVKLNMPVSFGTKIANISLSGAKWIEAKAKEAYVPYLNTLAKTELKADIQFPFADITSLKEERVFVSCSLQNDSAIYIKLVADKPKIPDGTLVSLKIVLPVKKSCIQVMKQAVVFQERLGNITPFVFSLKTEKDKCFVKEVPVVLGMLGENSIEVLHGLTGQETIVLFSNLGMKNLFTEMTVRVCNEE